MSDMADSVACSSAPGMPETGSSAEFVHHKGQQEGSDLQEAISRLCKPLIAPNSNLLEVAQLVLEEACHLSQSRHGYVSRIEKTGENRMIAWMDRMSGNCRMTDAERKLVFTRDQNGINKGLWSYTLHIKEPFYTNRPLEHPAAAVLPPDHLPIERFLSVPVMLASEIVGQIALANAPRDYTDTDLAAVGEIASLYALALQRVRYEVAFQQAAEQIRLALEAGKLGTWDYDFVSGEVFWDERCRSLFGITAGESLSYEQVMMIIHPEDRHRIDQTVKAALRAESNGSYSAEYRVVWTDGTVRWVAASGQVFFEGEGRARKAARFVGTIQDQTERKLVETALQESVEKFRTIFEHGNDAIFWADPDTGRMIRCNRKAEELTGRAREELIGMHQTLLHPPERDYAEAFRRAALQPTTSNIEAEVLTKSGRRIPVLINFAVVSLGEKRIVQGVFRDISARKQIEEALAESERRFRALFEQAGVGVAQVATVSGQFLHVNQKYCEILGRTPHEVRAQTFQQITHPEDLPRCLQQMDRLLQGEVREFSMEKRYLKQDGQTVWVRITVSPLWQKGQPPDSHVVVVEDITRRKQTEEALERAWMELEQRVENRTAELRQANESLRREIEMRRKTEEELIEAEFRYRTVAEVTHDWAYWEAPDGSLRYCSPSCERISGYSAEEFMAHPDLIHQIVCPEDQALWRSHRDGVMAESGPKVIQFRIRRKDGSLRWVEHACQPVLGKDGAFLGYRAGNRDISQRIEAELEKQRLREDLAHVTRVTTAGQFAASMAHELNQPLAAIHFNTQAAERFLAMDPPEIKEVQETLKDIRNDSQRAGKVIYHLRALFKKSGHERGAAQCNEIIQEILDLLHSEFLLKSVSPHLLLESQLPNIQCNRIELQQVVLNLIVNALEAMSEIEPDQRQLWVSTELESAGHIRVTIRDSGPGIPEPQFGQLFKPFFTTKATGMGMGLTICHAIVEAHGGRLWAENHPKGGAAFYLSLPILPENAVHE